MLSPLPRADDNLKRTPSHTRINSKYFAPLHRPSTLLYTVHCVQGEKNQHFLPRSSDENSVRLSFCLSLCQTRDLWQNGRNICTDFYTTRKII